MDRLPDKTYELSARAEGDDGKLNWYAAGKILQLPPATSIRATQAIKNIFAKAPLDSWVDFAARRPRDRDRDRDR